MEESDATESGAESSIGLPPDRCFSILSARDGRFDGRFFVGVTSTGIFCRPICPARTPKAANCTFWPSAAAAQAAGFRPCLRCRPEAAPGTPAWKGTAATVTRALRLIEEGAVDGEGSVEQLAARLGIGDRHLRRLFDRHLGTHPLAVARMRRVLFAKQLLDETALPMSKVALAAGFSSQRRFNACMRAVYGRPPSALRREGRGANARGRAATGSIVLTLPYRPPFAWDALLGFLALRAIPGVEHVDAADGGRYVRSLRVGPDGVALQVTQDPDRSRLRVEIRTEGPLPLIEITTRVRRLFDLDADPEAIDGVLSGVPRLASHVRQVPGVRVPGSVDGFETAVRAVLGQQVSVKGATTLAARVVERWGTELGSEAFAETGVQRAFPEPESLAEAPLEEIGLPRARGATVRAVAQAVLRAPELLESAGDLAEACAAWQEIPGIGPWTASYVALRVLGEPDACLGGDLVLRRALSEDPTSLLKAAEVERALEVARPYRGYASIRLWQEAGGD